MGVLRDFGIEEKLLCITTDNAANMGTMCKEIEVDIRNVSGFKASENWIPCFAHVMQLVANDIIKTGLKSEAAVHSEVYQVDESLNWNTETIKASNPLNKLRRGIIKIKYAFEC